MGKGRRDDRLSLNMNIFLMKFLLAFVCFSSCLYAQDIQNAIKAEMKKEVIYNGNRYKVYNNWISGGAGAAYSTGTAPLQFAGGVDYNFHLKLSYFQLGFLLSGDAFRNYNNTQLHLCYGKRKESNEYNFAYFGGLSYSTGYENSQAAKPYSTVGFYLNSQLVRKLKYDIGIGMAAFVDVNFTQTIGGLQIILYFSGAYKGKAK